MDPHFAVAAANGDFADLPDASPAPDGRIGRLADQDLRRAQYPSAVEQFDRVIALDSTYAPAYLKRVLALVQKYQLRMIVPVFNYFATDMKDVIARVQKLKDHPGTLFWEIGNEWNYNQFYSEGPAAIGFDGAKAARNVAIVAGAKVRLHAYWDNLFGDDPNYADEWIGARRDRVVSIDQPALFFVGHNYDATGGLHNIRRDAPLVARKIAGRG